MSDLWSWIQIYDVIWCVDREIKPGDRLFDKLWFVAGLDLEMSKILYSALKLTDINKRKDNVDCTQVHYI